MSLSGDTYTDNIIAQQRTLERRVAALERQLAGGAAAYKMNLENVNDATPEGVLPPAAAIPRLLVIAGNSNAVYEITCLDDVGPNLRAKLHLRYVGRVRTE